MSLITDIEQRVKELQHQRTHELENLQKQKTTLERELSQCGLPADRPLQFDIETKIEECNMQLKRWQNSVQLTEYLLQASPFLKQYVEEEQQQQQIKIKREENNNGRYLHHTTTTTTSSKGQNRGTLYQKFRMVTQGYSLFAYANDVLSGAIQEENAKSTLVLLRQQHNSTELYRGAGICPNEACPKRGTLQLRVEEGREICEECGASMEFVETTGTNMYGTEIDYNSGIPVIDKGQALDIYYAEFLEKLSGVSCAIPMSIYTRVYEHFKSGRTQQLTLPRVLDALAKLKLNKWKDRVEGFVMLLRGERPEYFRSSQIDCMLYMWKNMRPLYEKEHESKKRSSLLCQMVTYKLIQLLPEVDQRWLKFLPAPSSSSRSQQFEQTWRKICRQLNWKDTTVNS